MCIKYQFQKLTNMYIWGRNNNHLFKQNHKKTYSLPQKVPTRQQITHCAAGYDYIFTITQQGSLMCFYQSGLYQIGNFGNVVDISTTDNMVVMVTEDGTAWIMEFNADKIISGELKPNKITVSEPIERVFMNYSDIFLHTKEQTIYHLQRNEWYETKTYSDPTLVRGIEESTIITTAPGLNHNYFLSQQGTIFKSQKSTPTQAEIVDLSIKFVDVAVADYFVGVGTNGRLYVWGKYNEEDYDKPTQFAKITQQFIRVNLSNQNGYAITQAGEVWVWGKNANGELGISDYEPRVKPYPLITLDKQKIENIYIGEGYTVCTVQSARNPYRKTKTNGLRLSLNQSQECKPQVKKEKKSRQKIKKQRNIQVKDQSSSLKLRRTEKSPKYTENYSKGVNTEVMRQKSSNRVQGTPRKCRCVSKSQRSVSPLSNNNSHSKSPIQKHAKSPYLQHERQNSYPSNLKKKEVMNTTIENNQKQPNRALEQKNKIKELQRQIQRLKTQHLSKEQMSSYKLHECKDQTLKLKRCLQIKQTIIQDITKKIQMLQDAIQQHQRTLTARDNMMEQYQRRQKEYQVHVDQLQKNIDELIKGKRQVNGQESYYNEMYNSLKLDVAKEKEYFMKKLGDYEDLLQCQRVQYKQKIRNLEDQVNTFRSHSEKENIHRADTIKDKIGSNNRKGRNGSGQQDSKSQLQPLDQNFTRMNFIISRIEDSKVRIAKSATKLYQMMDDK